MSRRLDLTGHRSGRLVVVELAGHDKYGKSLWLCQCDCGSSLRAVCGNNLRRGTTTSCGCRRHESLAQIVLRHGESIKTRKTKEYRAWIGIKNRCTNPKYCGWKRYGGRGIKVCDRWLHSFENFLVDVGRSPCKGWSIDRINNDGDYDRGNVRWASPKEQANNRCTNKKKERMAA